MRDAVRDTLLGATVIGALAAGTWLLIRFGESRLLAPPRYEVRLETDGAAGLRVGSAVEMHGIPIGTVQAMHLVTDRPRPVEIVMHIDDSVRIPGDVRPAVRANVLGGAATLELDPSPTDVPPLAVDGTARIAGRMRSLLLEETLDRIDRLGEPLAEAARRFADLSATYLELGDQLGQLIASVSRPGDVPLGDMLARLDATITETGRAATAVRGWLEDASLRRSIEQTIADTGSAARLVAEAAGDAGDLARAAQDHLARLTMSIAQGTDALTTVMSRVDGMMRDMREGTGTMALLLNDPTLYLSLVDASSRLELALREARLLIEKLRAEGIRVGL